MDKKTSLLLYLAPVIGSLGFTFASPIIQVYFVSMVGPNILAMANIITMALAALVNASIPIERFKALYRKHFTLIVVADCLGYGAVCFGSMEYPEVRFLGCAVVNAVSQTLWMAVMKDAVNHKISGDELTDWNSRINTASLTASLAGSILAMFFTTLHVEICLGIQAMANVLCGIADWMAYRRLGNGVYAAADEENEGGVCHV